MVVDRTWFVHGGFREQQWFNGFSRIPAGKKGPHATHTCAIRAHFHLCAPRVNESKSDQHDNGQPPVNGHPPHPRWVVHFRWTFYSKFERNAGEKSDNKLFRKLNEGSEKKRHQWPHQMTSSHNEAKHRPTTFPFFWQGSLRGKETNNNNKKKELKRHQWRVCQPESFPTVFALREFYWDEFLHIYVKHALMMLYHVDRASFWVSVVRGVPIDKCAKVLPPF